MTCYFNFLYEHVLGRRETLTKVFPLVRRRTMTFTVRQTDLKVVSCKVVSSSKNTYKSNYIYLPLKALAGLEPEFSQI